MPIMQSCPACGAPCHIPDQSRGQLYACAECGAEFLTRPANAADPTLDPATPPPTESMQSTRVVQWPGPDSVVTTGPNSGIRLSDSPQADPEPRVILGDFHVIKKLGEGAMGAVYKARQLSLDRDVALKVLFSHVAKNPRSLERFCREARAMAKLDHPNIVRGFAVGEDQGKYYFAMELVRGASLQKLLGRLGKFSVGDALHITLACARALQYAHDLGLIHRDVKPDNVLVGKDGSIKLSDLGMVKFDEEELGLTQTGFGIGTPCYMPLEQARNGKLADARSDIYALGCMLYCLLVGQPPFLGASLVELVQAKDLGTFRPARRSNSEVPERLDLIIFKMTAKLPQHRYTSCAEVIRDLESLGLTNETLEFLSAKVPDPTATPDTGGRQTKVDTDTLLPPKGKTEDAEDRWYVRYRTRHGHMVVRKLTTAEVLELIEEDDFDVTAQGSRRSKDGFRALATYREFESVLLPRVTRAAADTRSRKLKDLYEKLSDEEERTPPKRRAVVESIEGKTHAAPNLLELPAVLLGRVLIFVSDRAEKGLAANIPHLLAALVGLVVLGYLFGWLVGLIAS